MRSILVHGDCLEKMRALGNNTVDAVVTDPPYGLSFMGKHWDYEVPSVEIWKEVLRVLKPGGHLLSFAGTRTYHRMAARIEDAGFEIRDMVSWIYGQGFPKSLDVSKAFDKAAGAERELLHTRAKSVSRGATGGASNGGTPGGYNLGGSVPITAPATDLAKQWEGWGTALKPALEPICLARKPLIGTVVENVREHGTGGLNIDACRVGFASEGDKAAAAAAAHRLCRDQNTGRTAYGRFENGEASLAPYLEKMNQGRWPSNVILDEEAGKVMDEQSGYLHGNGTTRNGSSSLFGSGAGDSAQRPGDKIGGGASRFFYCAKVSSKERNAGLEGMPKVQRSQIASKDGGGGGWAKDAEKNPNLPRANHHPTVKPIKLMEYLCKLVTPPGGIVLDPFMGSGSTGIAARSLGFTFIGIERDAEYFKIAESRIG